MNRTALVALMSALLAVVATSATQQQPQPQPAQATGTIQGRVIRSGTSDGIADVSLAAATLATQNVPSKEFRTVSDATGRFSFRELPLGQIRITAEREGYFGPMSGFVTLGNVVVQVTGQPGNDLTIPMAPAGVIGGRVTDSNRQPMVGVSVQLLRIGSQRGAPALQELAVKTTDDLGEYRHFNLPPGEYYVSVAPPRVGARGFRGAPPGPTMTVYHPNVTDINRATKLTMRGGEEMTWIDIQVTDAVGYTISGRVVSAVPPEASAPGRGARGERGVRGQRRGAAPVQVITATLTLLPRDSTIRNTPSRSSAATVQLINGEPGVFEILNVPPGVYDLFAQLPDSTGFGIANPPGQAQQGVAFGRTMIDLRSNLDNVTVTVHSGVDMKGHVTVDGAPTRTATQIAIESIDSAMDLGAYRQVSRFRPTIDADGSFTIPVVPEGRFRFQITPGSLPAAQRGSPARGLYVADVRSGGLSVYDDGINVGANPIGLIEVALATNGGAIEGVTVGADLNPARATVALVPLSRRKNPDLYKQAVSSATDGRYTFTNVPPGTYKLFAWDSPTVPYQDPNFLAIYEARASTVVVTAGSRITAPTITRVPEAELRR